MDIRREAHGLDHDADEAARSRVGSVLRDKWTLDTLIGVGGMAAVYAATHRNGRRGAVKMLHPELARHKDVRQRFLREGYVANKVGHPGAVAVLDDDVTEDGAVFLVMELLEGCSVDDLLERSPGRRVDAGLAIRVGVQLCEILACAHRAGIVHRDLKPENLFLTSGGQLKVLDFGIARVRQESGGGPGGSTSATQTGSVMGTPAFMPPEQALGEWSKVDGRSDLWAAGATLYAMVTGRVPHEDETAAKVLLRAMTASVAPVSTVAPFVPAALARVIDVALQREREARWQSAEEMGQALAMAERELAASTRHPAQLVSSQPTLASQGVPGTGLAVPSLERPASWSGPLSAPSAPTHSQPVPSLAATSAPHPSLSPTSLAVPATQPVPSRSPESAVPPTVDALAATWAGTLSEPSMPRPGASSTLTAASRTDYQAAPPRRSSATGWIIAGVLAVTGVATLGIALGPWRSSGSMDPAAESPDRSDARETAAAPEPDATTSPPQATESTATTQATAAKPEPPRGAPSATATSAATIPPLKTVAGAAGVPAPTSGSTVPPPSTSTTPAPVDSDSVFKGL